MFGKLKIISQPDNLWWDAVTDEGRYLGNDTNSKPHNMRQKNIDL